MCMGAGESGKGSMVKGLIRIPLPPLPPSPSIYVSSLYLWFPAVCTGVIEESAEFVRALVENGELQEEFLKMVTSPDAWSTMDRLSDCVRMQLPLYKSAMSFSYIP